MPLVCALNYCVPTALQLNLPLRVEPRVPAQSFDAAAAAVRCAIPRAGRPHPAVRSVPQPSSVNHHHFLPAPARIHQSGNPAFRLQPLALLRPSAPARLSRAGRNAPYRSVTPCNAQKNEKIPARPEPLPLKFTLPYSALLIALNVRPQRVRIHSVIHQSRNPAFRIQPLTLPELSVVSVARTKSAFIRVHPWLEELRSDSASPLSATSAFNLQPLALRRASAPARLSQAGCNPPYRSVTPCNAQKNEKIPTTPPVRQRPADSQHWRRLNPQPASHGAAQLVSVKQLRPQLTTLNPQLT